MPFPSYHSQIILFWQEFMKKYLGHFSNIFSIINLSTFGKVYTKSSNKILFEFKNRSFCKSCVGFINTGKNSSTILSNTGKFISFNSSFFVKCRKIDLKSKKCNRAFVAIHNLVLFNF